MTGFAIGVDKFCAKSQKEIETIFRKITFELFKDIVMNTPVDTGRARANWGVTVGKINTTLLIESGDQSGSATLANTAEGVKAWNCTGSIFLTNNLPYIGVLEYGRDDGSPGSMQAPNGMVRISVEAMQSWVKSL